MADSRAGVLLVGGGVTSVRCARTLRRLGHTGSIVLIADEPHLPYNRPPLSKEVLRDDVSLDLLDAEGAAWYERRGIELRVGTPATSVDRTARAVELVDGTTIRFDQLLLATGAAPRIPPIDGVERALTLRTVEDALALRAAVRPGSRVVIVGGGFIGVEVAASLAAIGAEVSVVELADRLWGGSLGPELSAWAARSLVAAGVTLSLGAAVTRIGEGTVAIGPEIIQADVVLLAVGVMPRDELARGAGLSCDDGIVTDAAHRTIDERIFAAGDVAMVAGLRVEHWHAAREGGERAAAAMLGERVADRRAPWIFSDFGERHLDVVGQSVGDERREVLSDPERGPGVVAWVGGGDRVVQMAATDGAVDVERARGLVESRATLTQAHRELFPRG
ncbi:MAG: FAD-dependent oxidoreductase [Chloroflexi bacterium]|nr:FAD-dependent oxidoreductase [Chloroflexota bacterium]